MKSVLHIINGYCGNRVYSFLISVLDSLGIKQLVYIPIRSRDDIGKYEAPRLNNTKYAFLFVIQSVFDRLFFFRKIRRICHDIESNDQFSKDALIHAHTLFSDGGVALKLHRKHQMEYLVAVRNTDVNLFFKYFFFLRGFGERILLNARKVIFLSPAYLEMVLDMYVKPKNQELIRSKSIVIPNPIDPFWQNNVYLRKVYNAKQIRLLFVGEIRRNKNIHGILEAARILHETGYDVRLSVIGFGLNDEKTYASSIRKTSDPLKYVNLIEQTKDKETLRGYYREADIFVMPSFTETFGLVYAEALSQGLPVIWSKGQGIDGYFQEGEIGYSVDPKNSGMIAEKVMKIMDRYLEISHFCSAQVSLFSQERIGTIYKSLYEE
jgi:glycosyltransferase involved in cell wall biosynthesis